MYIVHCANIKYNKNKILLLLFYLINLSYTRFWWSDVMIPEFYPSYVNKCPLLIETMQRMRELDAN